MARLNSHLLPTSMPLFPPALSYHLTTEKQTKLLAEATGKAAVQYVKQHGTFVLFLVGDLGCGKTTFTRYMAKSLPGGDEAEISSPSFTVCNVYPTCPIIWHCDLYRLGRDSSDEDLEQALEGENRILCLEWANWLLPALSPASRLEIIWQNWPVERKIEMRFFGDTATLIPLLTKAAQPHLGIGETKKD